MTPATKTETSIEERLERLERALDCVAMLLAGGTNISRLRRGVGQINEPGAVLCDILGEIRASKEA